MSGRLYNKTKRLYPSDLSLSGVTLESERTSSTIECDGYDQLVLYVVHTNSSATRIDINVDSSPNDGTDWCEFQSENISSGTATLSDLDYQKTVSASKKIRVAVPINDDQIRVRISGTSGGASDLVTVYGRLEVTGGD